MALATGLIAGAVHVLSGPDHLAALAPMAVRAPRRGPRLGATWGIGHGVGVIVMAAIGSALTGMLDTQWPDIHWLSTHWLSGLAERVVGVTLIVLGVRALRARRSEPEAAAGVSGALVFGLLHGAAGAAHLLSALPAMVLRGADTAAYLVGYLGAATLTMTLFGAVAGRLAASPRLGDRLLRASGVVAIAVGVAWLVLP